MNEKQKKVIEKAREAITLLLSVHGKDGELAGGWRIKEFVDLHEAIKDMDGNIKS